MTTHKFRIYRAGIRNLTEAALMYSLFRNTVPKVIIRLSEGSKAITRSACIMVSAIFIALPESALADTSTLKDTFNATCASGLRDPRDLTTSFGEHGFDAASTSDSYGHFTGSRAGQVGGYHIVSGSWSCFVAGPVSTPIDTCVAAQELGATVLARFPDGACLAARAVCAGP